MIDVVTKPGSPQFHGNAFEFLRNEATDARGFFDVPGLPRGIFRQNQYGATLSGPVARPRISLRHTKDCAVVSASSTQHLVPDAAVRGGNFSGGQMIFDPLSLDSSGNRLPFAGNMIPASRIDRAAREYLALYEPLPNAAIVQRRRLRGFDAQPRP